MNILGCLIAAIVAICIAYLVGISVLSYQQVKHCGWYAACDPHYYDNGIEHAWRPL